MPTNERNSIDALHDVEAVFFALGCTISADNNISEEDVEKNLLLLARYERDVHTANLDEETRMSYLDSILKCKKVLQGN